jgi:hypothetical protein
MATHVEQMNDVTFVVMDQRFPNEDWKVDMAPGDEIIIQMRKHE